MILLAVFFGAFLGAPTRYLLDRAVQSRHESTFPWGTFSVNILGCFILGGLAGLGSALPGTVSALLGTGFCGALTTYSTFSYETLRLAERKLIAQAAMNLTTSLLVGFGALLLAYNLTETLATQ